MSDHNTIDGFERHVRDLVAQRSDDGPDSPVSKSHAHERSHPDVQGFRNEVIETTVDAPCRNQRDDRRYERSVYVQMRFSSSARPVCSQVKSFSDLPKCPYAAVAL